MNKHAVYEDKSLCWNWLNTIIDNKIELKIAFCFQTFTMVTIISAQNTIISSYYCNKTQTETQQSLKIKWWLLNMEIPFYIISNHFSNYGSWQKLW